MHCLERRWLGVLRAVTAVMDRLLRDLRAFLRLDCRRSTRECAVSWIDTSPERACLIADITKLRQRGYTRDSMSRHVLAIQPFHQAQTMDQPRL